MKLRFPNGEHGEVEIGDQALTIGCRAENDLVLTNEGIQARHAHLVPEGDGLVVVPEGIANIALNGRRVTGRTPVKAGDVLVLYRVEVHVDDSAQARHADITDQGPAMDDGTRIRVAVVPFQLRGLSGHALGHVYRLSPRTAIGRDESCDVSVDAKEISRRHALLEATPSAVRITDLGSANGTFVNGERIMPNQPQPIQINDEISFDKERFRLEPVGGGAQEQPPAPAKAPKGGSRTNLFGVGVIVAIVIVLVLAWLWWT